MIMWGVFRKGVCIRDFRNLCGNGSGNLFVLPVKPGYGRRAARTHDDSSGVAGTVNREHRLGTYIEGLEHDLCHAVTVCLRDKNKMLATQGGQNGCSRARSNAVCSKWLLSGAPNHNVLEIAALLRTATQGGRTGCSRMDRKQKTRTKQRLWPKTEFVLQGLWPKTVIVLQGL